MSYDAQDEARRRLSALAADGEPDSGRSPARCLEQDAGFVGRLFAATGSDENGAGVVDKAAENVEAALGLLGGMRVALDQLEVQVVMDARRRGMDWRQIAHRQGLNSSQAASQRYQRLVTRLEEIRQGVR